MTDPATEELLNEWVRLGHFPHIDGGWTVPRMVAAIMADAQRPVREWAEIQRHSPWSEGWSEEFKRGYDAALEEVESRIGREP